MLVYKLTRDNSSFIVSMPSDLWYELDNMEEEDEFTISAIEMDEEEFMNLPEFEGW